MAKRKRKKKTEAIHWIYLLTWGKGCTYKFIIACLTCRPDGGWGKLHGYKATTDIKKVTCKNCLRSITAREELKKSS